MENVKLREVVMRDGLQSIDKFIPTKIKIELINKIIDSGIKEIEVTSFVSPLHVPQLKDASELVMLLPKNNNNIVYGALIPNLRGAKRAILAGIKSLIIVISASDSHNQANIGKSINQSLRELPSIFEVAKYNNISVIGSISVAFGCPYENNVKKSNIFKIIENYLSLGASSLILADTIGIANSNNVIDLLKCYKNQFSKKLLTLHFHNNNGKAMQNLLSAVEIGFRSFDTSLGGIGGCPYVPSSAGNLPTENVVKILKDLKIDTGVNLQKISNTVIFLKKILSHNLSR